MVSHLFAVVDKARVVQTESIVELLRDIMTSSMKVTTILNTLKMLPIIKASNRFKKKVKNILRTLQIQVNLKF